MYSDRRKPLGGIEKTTYVESGGHPMTYDLLAGLRGEVCNAIMSVKEEVEEFRNHDVQHCQSCKAELSNQYIKKAFGKWPVSIVELIAYVLITGILVGSAILDPKGLLEHFIKL